MGDDVASDEPRDDERPTSSEQREAFLRIRDELQSALSDGTLTEQNEALHHLHDALQTGIPEGAVSEQEAEFLRLYDELQTAISMGGIPNGWIHRVYWTSDPGRFRHAWVFTLVSVVLFTITGWAIWGWIAGLGCGLLAFGLSLMMSSFRGGPRVGDVIRHTWSPPVETQFQLGIADHEVMRETREWGELFETTTIAGPDDRRRIRLSRFIVGVCVATFGIIVVLVESGVLSTATALHALGVAYLILSCCIAVWYWRSTGRAMAAAGSETRREKGSIVQDALDSATTGESPIKIIGVSLFDRLPRRIARPAAAIWILLSGVMALVVSFAIAPSATALLPPISAAASLIAFVLGGVRNLAAVGVGLVRRDRRLLLSGLVGIALMGVLLLIAKLFGWLDEWQAVLAWITGSNRSG